MALDELAATIAAIKERINGHRASLAANETRTRQVLIDPLLAALGWNVSDPNQVELEYDVRGRRADYALLVDAKPVAVIEAKRLGHQLVDDNTMQVMNYANTAGIEYMVVTNGDEWKMYSVFERGPIEERVIMDLNVAGLASHVSALKSLSLWHANLNLGPTPTVASNPVLVLPVRPDPVPSEDESGRESTNGNDGEIAGDWQILGGLVVQGRDKPPTKIRIGSTDVILPPYNEKRKSPPYKDWTGFLVSFAKWLVDSKRLTFQNCPVTQYEGSKRYLVNNEPIHLSGRKFHAAHEIGRQLWIEKNLDTPGKKRSLTHLLEHCGIDPQTILVRFD